MKLIRINKDLIFRCKWCTIEFIHNCYRGCPNWGEFSTEKHKYIHLGAHVIAIHLR